MSSQKYHRIDYDTVVICKNCNKNTFIEYLCHPLYSQSADAYHKFCPKCMINSRITCPDCYKLCIANPGCNIL